MAVLIETSRGDLTVDLYVDECPLAAKNFLKLCKIKYYNNCLFHKVDPCQNLPSLPALQPFVCLLSIKGCFDRTQTCSVVIDSAEAC